MATRSRKPRTTKIQEVHATMVANTREQEILARRALRDAWAAKVQAEASAVVPHRRHPLARVIDQVLGR